MEAVKFKNMATQIAYEYLIENPVQLQALKDFIEFGSFKDEESAEKLATPINIYTLSALDFRASDTLLCAIIKAWGEEVDWEEIADLYKEAL